MDNLGKTNRHGLTGTPEARASPSHGNIQFDREINTANIWLKTETGVGQSGEGVAESQRVSQGRGSTEESRN